jgi:tetratricopeptide repeat protein 21B
MLEDYENAYNFFQEAAALDESKIESLSGMIHARILQGVIEDAEKQLEFVTEIQSGTGRTPDIAYLQALLASRREYSKDEQDMKIISNIKFVDEALKLHISFTKTLFPGFDFYIKLDPNFLLSLSLGTGEQRKST